MRAVTVTLLIAIAALASACTSDHQGDDTSYNCANETRDDEFVVGIQKAGDSAKMMFTLMAADPAPPARGDNTWMLQLTQMSGGSAVAGAQILVTPFMPDHAHGTPLSVVVEPQPTAGHYKLSPVNMWMPGLWEVTIDAQSGADSDTTIFRFCIPS
jgi:hypothetical protein